MRTRFVSMFTVFLTLVLGTALLSAQETGGDDLLTLAPELSFEGEVTVTGSLIPRKDLTALSPVTVMEIPTELTYSGIVRIEDLVTTMPQVFAGQNSTLAGRDATGTASIDLRYLGPHRTLVLINGRRMAFGDYNGADINAIPASLVRRVDVLTGGASAVYGSDALAGVVNFILDTDFTGVRGGLQYSFYNHDNSNQFAQQLNEEQEYPYPTGLVNDGDAFSANIAIGGAFADGKGHATAYIDYRNIESLTKSQRDYLNCSVWATENGPICGGSAANGRGNVFHWAADGTPLGWQTLHLQEDGGDGHSFRAWFGEDLFNYGPYWHIQRPDEKWNAGAFVNYEINKHFDAYMEIMYMSDYSDAQQAPSGSFGTIEWINCDNPMLSEQQHDVLCAGTGYGDDEYARVSFHRRNIEGGPRINQLGHTNSRIIAGLRGDITEAWSYDLYGLRAESQLQNSYINDVHSDRLIFAVDVIEDPATGEWVCRDEQARADGCVPWNVFQEGAVTQEATDYISTVAVLYGQSTTEVLNLTFTGDLEGYGLIIPSASEGLQVAAGAEYRNERLIRVPDEVSQTALAGAIEDYPIDESFNVVELYIETLVPILQDVKGAQDLSLELGYRWSDYSASGVFDTYKAQASWAISPSWRLRGGYNRAIRAPSVAELYEPVVLGWTPFFTDPCQGDNPIATFEQCARTGVTAAQYENIPDFSLDGSSGSNTISGGNPHVKPETGDTYTAGIVWTPTTVHGLSVTLDYYRININEAIDVLTAETVHRVCMDTGNPTYCDQIHRDEQGSLWISEEGYTDLTKTNVGRATSEGIDVNANYLIGLGGAGYLATDLMGTYMLTNDLSNPKFNYECVGYFGLRCGTPQSLWRHRFRATWESAFNLNLSMAWRMIGPSDVDYASPSPDLSDPDEVAFYYANGSNRIRAYNWFDVAASYTMPNGLKFTVGVNNVLDEEPPLLPNFADEPFVNLYGSYDPLGRYIFGSVQFNF